MTTPSAPTRPSGPAHPSAHPHVGPYAGPYADAYGPHAGAPLPTARPAAARPWYRRPARVAAVSVLGALALTGTTAGAGALALATGDDLAAALATRSVSTDASGPAPEAAVGAVATDGVDWGAVADAVSPGVVAITVRAPDGSGGEGSGVVYDAEGLVLTNNHVVAAARGGGVQVTLFDGRVLDADVVGTDPSTDLAVVRLVNPPEDLAVVPLGESEDLGVGDPVMAVGNPLGLAGTVTTGIVSALDRPVTTQAVGVANGEPVVTDAIQTDAAVNPGNSGGPLVDSTGRVVGINSSIATTGPQSGSVGLGFAIPVDVARAVAASVVEDGSVEHARLGAYLQDATATVADGQWQGTRLGAGLADVVPGSPAEEADLRAGDVVVAVAGEPTTSSEALTARVRALRPGDEVTLTVVRGTEAVEVPVTLAPTEG
ncbi:S1C family serine protease [Aquipuribacter sp. SD81]|uniref:S1C family serine protease n=1 Tax=Aquipuribacter sp. SD81 TaxID=3127703 RepID=UPI003015DBA0